MPRIPENNRFSLTIPADARWLTIVRATISKACELAAFPPTEAGHIVLAVDEACSNIIKYAYKHDSAQKIAVTVRVSEGRLEVILDDEGPQVRLEDLQGRSLNDVRPGGLGLHLIKRAFDTVAFDGRKKRGNRLKLVRTLEEKA